MSGLHGNYTYLNTALLHTPHTITFWCLYRSLFSMCQFMRNEYAKKLCLSHVCISDLPLFYPIFRGLSIWPLNALSVYLCNLSHSLAGQANGHLTSHLHITVNGVLLSSLLALSSGAAGVYTGNCGYKAAFACAFFCRGTLPALAL